MVGISSKSTCYFSSLSLGSDNTSQHPQHYDELQVPYFSLEKSEEVKAKKLVNSTTLKRIINSSSLHNVSTAFHRFIYM